LIFEVKKCAALGRLFSIKINNRSSAIVNQIGANVASGLGGTAVALSRLDGMVACEERIE